MGGEQGSWIGNLEITKMIKTPIKRGQIWQHKVSGKRCVIFGTNGRKWRTRTLQEKSENHSLSNLTLWCKFTLVDIG